MSISNVNLPLEQIKARMLSFIALAFMVCGSVAIDQISKVHSENTLMKWSHDSDLDQYIGQQYPLGSIGAPPESKDDNRFYLSWGFNYVRNQGAAWGFLHDLKDSIRVPFFTTVTVLAILFVISVLRFTPLSFRLLRYAFTLILSGAIGNFVDRMRLGYVIDWIDVEWNIAGWYYRFPNFNFADSCISIGVALFVIDAIFLERKREKMMAEL